MKQIYDIYTLPSYPFLYIAGGGGEELYKDSIRRSAGRTTAHESMQTRNERNRERICAGLVRVDEVGEMVFFFPSFGSGLLPPCLMTRIPYTHIPYRLAGKRSSSS